MKRSKKFSEQLIGKLCNVLIFFMILECYGDKNLVQNYSLSAIFLKFTPFSVFQD